MAAAANDSVADEKAPAGRYEEMDQDGGSSTTAKSQLSGLLWHGGSAYDAWFSCASNQVRRGPGAADVAILLLAAGDDERHHVPALLRPDGQLDGVPHQHAVPGVPDQEGEGEEGGLQEPRHPVVRGARWAAREALEKRRAGLQLHVPPLRLRHPAHRMRQQHLLHQRPAGQADVDVHLRRVLRHDGVHPVLPQLPDLVLPRPRHDHLHRLVPRRRVPPPRPGRRREALGPDQAGALLHRGNQHSLHFRRACCHCGGDARDVAAAEVQGDLPDGDGVRADADAAVGGERVLGVRGRAAHALQRALPAAPHALPGRRRHTHAHPPGHHLRLRMHAALLRLGEAHRPPRLPQPLQARRGEAPRRRAHLVPRHRLPLLRAHQLRRGFAARQLHRLHHPGARAYGHVPLCTGPRERRGAAAAVRGAMDGHVRDQHVRGGVGAGGGLRLRRLGQHDQLHPPDQLLRPLHQVLPVPRAGSTHHAAAVVRWCSSRLLAVPRRSPQLHDAPAGAGARSFPGGAFLPPPPASSQPRALKLDPAAAVGVLACSS